MKAIAKNEKTDRLYSVGLVLISLLLLFVCELFDFYWEWTSYLLLPLFAVSNALPAIIRRKRQYKKIDELRKKLNLSLDELKKLADIDKFALMNWQSDKTYLSQKKLYILEDRLEKMYVKAYGKPFETTSDQPR